MSIVYSRYPLVSPSLAKAHFVVKQTQFLNDVVHNEVYVDLWLISHAFFVGLAKLANLADVKPFIRVKLKHAHDDSSQLRRVLLTEWWILSFCNPLKEVIK